MDAEIVDSECLPYCLKRPHWNNGKGVELAKKQSLLEQMRQNPRRNWSIDDVAKVCTENGIQCMSPTRGTHYKVASPLLDGHLTVPAHRPIKPFYIKELVGMIAAHHIRMTEGKESK